MKIIDPSDIHVAIVADCGVQVEGHFPKDRTYLVPTKKWCLEHIANGVDRFQKHLHALYFEQSSDCDDLTLMAKVRAAFLAGAGCDIAVLFTNRANAETLGNSKRAAITCGYWFYTSDVFGPHCVMFILAINEQEKYELLFFECVPPVMFIKLSEKEKQSCDFYFI